MMAQTYSVPWSNRSRNNQEDSAFLEDEHEYSNPANMIGNVTSNSSGSNSNGNALLPPDYEEVVTAAAAVANPVRRIIRTSNSRGGLVYNIHSPMPSSADNAISNLLYANTTASASSNASSSTNSPNLGKGGGTLESNVSSGFDELDIGDSIGSAALEGRDKIMQANVYCIHKNDGCKWQGPLGKLKAHLNACQRDAVGCPRPGCGAKIARLVMEDHLLTTCPGRPATCPFCPLPGLTGATVEEHRLRCAEEPVDCDQKCGQKVARSRLRAHRSSTCSKRVVSCQYCERGFAADTVRAHHAKCALYPVACPNRCTSKPGGPVTTMPRDEVERHLSEECAAKSPSNSNSNSSNSNSGKPCSFSDAGCQFRSSSRQDAESHLREAEKLHLDLMCSLVQRQRTHIDKLTTQLERATTSYNGVLVWKVRDFSSRLREARSSEGLELVSVPFFTSQCGYRLQASLFLDGNGSGEGSHLSAYIKILPGEFDSILRWPFRHTVSFSLLDQAEDRRAACNVVESFIPDPSWPNFRRPSPSVEPDQLGFGFPKFVPHELLLSPARSYVREDCLFVKIRVDPARNVAV